MSGILDRANIKKEKMRVIHYHTHCFTIYVQSVLVHGIKCGILSEADKLPILKLIVVDR